MGKNLTTSMDDISQRLVSVSFELYRIVPIFQLILGTFGNIMNILIFTHRPLRTNPCSFYFLASSINNLFVLGLALLTRLLSSGWQIDPANSNIILCKLRIFFVYSSLSLIQWFVVLASIDRYFTTCYTFRYRQMSNLPVARKAVALTILIVCVAHFHTLIWWSVDYIGDDLYCNIFIPTYEIAFQIFFLIFTYVLPLILMIIFGTLMILNVRKLLIQIQAESTNRLHGRSRSKDRQLIKMLLVQVIIVIFFSAPFVGVNMFDMLVMCTKTQIYNPNLQLFFENICRLILYFNPMIGFYIYTLFSRTFRTEIKQIMKNGFRYISNKFALQRLFLNHPQNPVITSRHLREQRAKSVKNNYNHSKY